MEVLDCIALEVDRYASLAFLAFVEHVDVVDVERSTIGMDAGVEYIIDTENILDRWDDTDPVERMVYDMELVEFPILH